MGTYRDVGWTSSREGITARQYAVAERALRELRERGATHFHHGDCVNGDEAGAMIAVELGYVLISHPPENPKLRAYITPAFYVCRPLPYLIRNQAIVDCSDVVVACPKSPHADRSGTWRTLRMARNGAADYIAIWPDGGVVQRGCEWIEVPS